MAVHSASYFFLKQQNHLSSDIKFAKNGFLLNIQVKTYEDIIEDMLVRLDEFCQTADMVSKISIETESYIEL